MKSKEFKTSKGEFVIVDSIGRENYYDVIRYYIENNIQIKYINLLKYINENQASNIVDSQFVFHTEYVKDIMTYYPNYESKYVFFYNSLDSIHSLIKSLGIHLYENPYKDWLNTDDYDISEQNTFYNPYIFKKI